MNRRRPALPFAEFVTLLAMMISILALSIDIMLPALGVMAADLQVADPNDVQIVISSLFFGFAIGQIVAGPLSDSFGRKPVIYGGYVLFILGCILSITASSLTTMVLGRILQGLGASCPRIVAVALVRDIYEGRAMARVMSIVMAIFIIVPTIAPAIGQGIMVLTGWRMTFALLMAFAVLAVVWFALRQPETLSVEQRRPLALASIGASIAEVLRYRIVFGYALGAGCIFGAFLGYLSSAQQIFAVSFDAAPLFPLYFALAALSLGAASLLNAKLVMRFGMRTLTRWALAGSTLVSAVFLLPVLATNGIPPFWSFMLWLMINFFFIGTIFGNINALAMEPLGHMAGLGAAVVGSLTTIISLPLGWAVGASFDGGVSPVVAGFALLGAAALAAMSWAEKDTLA